MFGAFTKAITSLWGQDEEPVLRRDRPPDGALGKSDNVWYFEGKITSLHNGYGLVNDEVYFSRELLAGASVPHVGQAVYVCARRQQGTGGWRAESVTVRHDGDTDWTDTPVTRETEASADVESSQQEMIAVVTSMSHDSGLLDETISFCVADIVDESYAPCAGDTVTAVVVTGNLLQRHAVDIKPVRRLDIEGEITAAMSDHGYIVCPGGVDVYYSCRACGDGYAPSRGDLVSGVAVETVRGRCQWRALLVKPRSRAKQSTDWLKRYR